MLIYTMKTNVIFTDQGIAQDISSDCCRLLLEARIFASLDSSLRSCPLGVAAAAAVELLQALTWVTGAYAVERYELLLRVIMERFRFTTLMFSRWPLFTMLQSVEAGLLALPIEKKYSLGFDFPFTDQDFQQLRLSRATPGYLSNFSDKSLAHNFLHSTQNTWTSLAQSVLKTVLYLVQSGMQPLAMVTFSYGSENMALVPIYARRFRSLAIDSTVLICGDEGTWEACTQHWWPSSELCIHATSVKYGGILKFAVPAFIQQAGLDVFFFQL